MRNIIIKNRMDIITIMMKIVMIINMKMIIMNMNMDMNTKMTINMNMNMIMDMNTTMKNMNMTMIIINMKNTIIPKNMMSMKTIICIITITTITKIFMVYFYTLQLTLWEAWVIFSLKHVQHFFYILGVIISLVLIELFQWYIADAIASFVISLMISGSIIPLIKSSAEILLQSYPKKYRKNVINLMENVKNIEP